MPHARTSARVLIGLAWLAGCATPPPPGDPGGAAQVNALLEALPDSRALDAFAGAGRRRCFPSSASSELCEWRIGYEQVAWQPLTDAIGASRELNLLCEIPRTGAARARESCSVHERRSNRAYWSLPTRAPNRGKPSDPKRRAEIEQSQHARADQMLAAADTLARLSRVMGALPDACAPTLGREQVCTWQTTSSTYGHGTLAAWIGAPRTKKIQFQCLLPLDGSPRAPSSCGAEIGARRRVSDAAANRSWTGSV